MAEILAQDDDHKIKNGDLKNDAYVHHFRVTIFGSARIKKNDPHYQQVHDLARRIGKHGFDVVTGGGPGIMEAANSGHQEGRKDQNSHSIGLTIQLPWESESNRHLDLNEHFNRFSDRLDEFLKLSNVAVMMHGGVGTLLELFYVWQHIQVKHISSIPIILVGPMWDGLVKWLKKEPLKLNTISPHDFQHLYHVHSNDKAMEIILHAFERFQKEGEDYVLNFEKYRVVPQKKK